MQLIRSPWNEMFYDLVGSCKKSIKITSPYLKEHAVKQLIERKQTDTALQLVTSFKLMNYHVGASDLSALDLIINNNGTIRNLQKLHSKIYIFDDQKAVITSGNLTNGGLVHNYEYGVLIDELKEVKRIEKDFDNLLNDKITGEILANNIEHARKILSEVPKTKPIVLPAIENYADNEEVEIYTGGIRSITSTLSGWMLEVFNCLNEIPKPVVTLKEVKMFVPTLQKRHPGNNNIDAKIRQQLQYLRNIGLIEFVEKGVYRKLWK